MTEPNKVRQISKTEAKNIDPKKVAYFTLSDGTVFIVKDNINLENSQFQQEEIPEENEQINIQQQPQTINQIQQQNIYFSNGAENVQQNSGYYNAKLISAKIIGNNVFNVNQGQKRQLYKLIEAIPVRFYDVQEEQYMNQTNNRQINLQQINNNTYIAKENSSNYQINTQTSANQCNCKCSCGGKIETKCCCPIVRKTSNPLLYMNSLLNLYKDTLTMIDLDLFEKYIKFPKILVNNKMYKKLIKKKENLKFNLDKSDIDKFNSFFTDNKTIIENNNLYIKEEEDSDEYEEDKKIESDNDLEEEDEDKYEEDEIDNFEENNEISEESEEDDMNEIKDVNFEFILNKEILKTLFYLYENKESNIDINNKFITQSKEYSNGLEKFLQEHNLV